MGKEYSPPLYFLFFGFDKINLSVFFRLKIKEE